MSLVDLELPARRTVLPDHVNRFLNDAERRIERYQSTSRSPAFVPSDFVGAYGVLESLAESSLAPGNRFCEWGSGFGVVACLASMLEFDSCGIEIEQPLVDAARLLANDYDLPVEFICNSFIPEGGEPLVEIGNTFAWLTTEVGPASDEFDLAPDDFDVIFAYPWPDEDKVINDLFDRFASVGSLLLTYIGIEEFRLQRKVRSRRRVRN